MKLNAPKQATFIVTLILAILSLIAWGGMLAPLAPYTYWLMTIAYALLALACLLRGL